MRLVKVKDCGTNYDYKWPDAVESFATWIEYRAVSPDGEHLFRIGFGIREVYGRDRSRVVVWVDGKSCAEFLCADDFNASGDVLSEIKLRNDAGHEWMCRYPDEAVPARYAALPIMGLPTRVSGPYLHNAWAVVANVADHGTLCALAELRRVERDEASA